MFLLSSRVESTTKCRVFVVRRSMLHVVSLTFHIMYRPLNYSSPSFPSLSLSLPAIRATSLSYYHQLYASPNRLNGQSTNSVTTWKFVGLFLRLILLNLRKNTGEPVRTYSLRENSPDQPGYLFEMKTCVPIHSSTGVFFSLVGSRHSTYTYQHNRRDQ